MTRRRDGQEQAPEVEQPVWVKFSTSFKKELATLDAYSLKVFLYIGLSINFDTGEAHPGVRKTAEDTNMDKGTVVEAILKLEGLGLLTVYRRHGAGNIYQPNRYIGIGTVRPDRTLRKLYGDEPKLYGENEKLYGAQEGILHNKNNKINKTPSITQSTDFSRMTVIEAMKIPSLRAYRDATGRSIRGGRRIQPSMRWCG